MCSGVFNNRTKKNIKSIIKVGILAGVLFCFVMSLRYGLLNGIIVGFLFFLGWTLLMCVFLIPIDYFSAKKLPKEASSVFQEKNIIVKLNIDHAYELCIKSVRSLGRVKLSKNTGINKIVASTRPGLFSFGEQITLVLKELSENRTSIHVTSQPIVKYTKMDYGKNFKNVAKIIDNIFDLMKVG
jgi:hypothetical protein